MFSLSLSLFGRYLSINAGRVEDAWAEDGPEEEAAPDDEAALFAKPSCWITEDAFYD